MTDLRKAAQQALEALERDDRISGYPNNKAAITALRVALAQPDVPEVLFDGYRVLKALTPEAATRTTHVNVSDVLDAVVAVMMREGAAPKGGA